MIRQISSNSLEENAFTSMEDFCDCMERNGEVEFEWQGKHYSITYPRGIISVGEMYNEDSFVDYNSIEELLQYQIGDNKLSDIFMEITVHMRTV